ncbi:MAG: 2OG-Fe dioxygenase family protein [Rudaea sp.]
MNDWTAHNPASSRTGELNGQGFSFVGGDEMNGTLGNILGSAPWNDFSDSWNRLPLDNYLAEHGTYRRRRHAVYSLSRSGKVERQAHQPHYQSKTYNTLQGGIERWFEPIEPAIGAGEVLLVVLKYCGNIFGSIAPSIADWRAEVHQFRIEARADQEGLPTPEGVHRDGVDYVLVLLIARNNIASGTTTIHTADGTQLGSFTLTQPLDAALVDDERVFHGVTPVQAVDDTRAAFRDVLVVTLVRINTIVAS